MSASKKYDLKKKGGMTHPNMACVTNYIYDGCHESCGSPVQLQVIVWLILSLHKGKKGEQHINGFEIWRKKWEKLCPTFQTRVSYWFYPHVFVITGKLASTAFRWLLGFCWYQLKKLFVWKVGQGLIYSPPMIFLVFLNLNQKKELYLWWSDVMS